MIYLSVFWAEVEGGNVSGVSLYRPRTLSLMWYNWSLQASVTLPPPRPPTPPSTVPVSPPLCCCLFGSGLLVLMSPRTPGVLYVLCLSLSSSRAPLLRLSLLARYRWPAARRLQPPQKEEQESPIQEPQQGGRGGGAPARQSLLRNHPSASLPTHWSLWSQTSK